MDRLDADEERLVNWVREQRRHYESLCTYHRERLERDPGFRRHLKHRMYDLDKLLL